MTVNATYGISVSGSGLSIQASVIRSGSAPIGLSESLGAAKTGTLSTRTDDDTGTLTMTGGHGLTDGQEIDIYWDGGVHRGATIGTVATNSVPFDGGTGTLPAQSTPVTVFVRSTANVYIDGDNAGLIAVEIKTPDRTLRNKASVECYDADDDLIATLNLTTNVPQVFDLEGGATNPFTGDPITYLVLSQGGTVAADLQLIGVYDATP
jgi:hypothetical protein